MTMFKIGDRVQVKLSAGFSRGIKGVVVEGRELRFPPPEGAVFVLRDDASSSCWFHEDELELLERPSESNQNPEIAGKTTPEINESNEDVTVAQETQIDWNSAPEGTTHHQPETESMSECWVQVHGKLVYFRYEGTTSWTHWFTFADEDACEYLAGFYKRPIQVKSYEEKISEKYNIPLDTVKRMKEDGVIWEIISKSV